MLSGHQVVLWNQFQGLPVDVIALLVRREGFKGHPEVQYHPNCNACWPASLAGDGTAGLLRLELEHMGVRYSDVYIRN